MTKHNQNLNSGFGQFWKKMENTQEITGKMLDYAYYLTYSFQLPLPHDDDDAKFIKIETIFAHLWSRLNVNPLQKFDSKTLVTFVKEQVQKGEKVSIDEAVKLLASTRN